MMHRIAQLVFAEFLIRDSDKQHRPPAGPGSAARPMGGVSLRARPAWLRCSGNAVVMQRRFRCLLRSVASRPCGPAR